MSQQENISKKELRSLNFQMPLWSHRMVKNARCIQSKIINYGSSKRGANLSFLIQNTNNRNITFIFFFLLGITQEEGQPWNEQRRFFLQTAKNFGFGKQEFEHHIQDEIKILLQELRKFDGKPNDLRFHLAYTFNSIVCKVLFNKKFDKDTSFKRNLNSLNQMVQIFTGVLHMLIGFPFYIATNILGDKEIPKGKKEVQTFIDQVVDEIKLHYDPSNPNSYVDSYVQQMDEFKKKGKLQESSFTDQRLKANAVNLFLEGTESVSSTVASLLVELSKHPDVQKKVQEELDSVVGRERLLSWTDKQNLPYLDATIQELYRTAALFLVTTMYSNFKETTIEGYRIPERSAIVSNLYSIHFDPELFPNPQKFDPGRFLNSEGKRIKVEGGPYLFGLGKRSCIGESLAQVEIFLLIGSLLQSFTIPYAKDIDSLRVIPRQ
ncbi:Cytochrome P450 2C39 [Araneus ventricosus]|uniref:Cytochrome P450 2C39 n=1 Tax=Araneus ventricosus TaxID=182803 RepID=A0A4Y2H818_ARAVE|nr:Cytochrome P450 2C39 [Araneus ventricosus]